MSDWNVNGINYESKKMEVTDTFKKGELKMLICVRQG